MSEAEVNRAPGRPAVYDFEKKLAAELRRLTGCGARQIRLGMERAKHGASSLDWLELPAEKTLGRAIRGTPPGHAASTLQPRTTLPDRWHMHIVPIIFGQNENFDLALVWEPFSSALFGEVRSSFESADALTPFLKRSATRVPAPLRQNLLTIELTRPAQSPNGHWTTQLERRHAVTSYNVFLSDMDAVPVSDAEMITGDLNTLDLRQFARTFSNVDNVRQELNNALNRYNIGVPDSVFEVRRPAVKRVWFDSDDDIVDDQFHQRHAVRWSPAKRMAAVLSCYGGKSPRVPSHHPAEYNRIADALRY